MLLLNFDTFGAEFGFPSVLNYGCNSIGVCSCGLRPGSGEVLPCKFVMLKPLAVLGCIAEKMLVIIFQ